MPQLAIVPDAHADLEPAETFFKQNCSVGSCGPSLKGKKGGPHKKTQLKETEKRIRALGTGTGELQAFGGTRRVTQSPGV